MPVLMYRDPADGQMKPISFATDGEVWVGPDEPPNTSYDLWLDTDDPGETLPDLDARYVSITGDTMTGTLDAEGLKVGKVWGDAYRGLQANGEANGGSAALLLSNAAGGGGQTYLIGEPAGIVVLRPDAAGGGTYDYQFTKDGLVLPVSGSGNSHAVTKGYVDGAMFASVLHLDADTPVSAGQWHTWPGSIVVPASPVSRTMIISMSVVGSGTAVGQALYISALVNGVVQFDYPTHFPSVSHRMCASGSARAYTVPANTSVTVTARSGFSSTSLTLHAGSTLSVTVMP